VRFGLLLVGLAVAAAPASAQSSKLVGPPDLAVRMVHDFGQCVVKHAPDQARRVLARDYTTRAYKDSLRQLVADEHRCASAGRLSSNGLLFAGGLAEALLPGELAGAGLGARTVVDPAHPLSVHGESELMSVCLIRKSPDDVAALLATAPTTPEEQAAVQKLAPNIVDCVAKGQKMVLNTPSLRAMLALSAYRLVENYNAALAANGS
jgi:hypothetical protein